MMADDNTAYLVFESSVSEGEAHFESAPSRIELHKQIMLFGRGSPKNPVDVCIKIRKDDKEIISRNHAEISRTFQGQYILRDLDSMNGTFVNGRRIERHVLSESDIVQFGGESKVPINSILKSNDTCIRYKFTLERRKRKRASNGGGDSLASSTNVKSPSSLDRGSSSSIRKTKNKNDNSNNNARSNFTGSISKNKVSAQQPGQHLLHHAVRRLENEREAEWIDEDELNELRRKRGEKERIKIKTERGYQQSRHNNNNKSKRSKIRQVTRDDEIASDIDDDQSYSHTSNHSRTNGRDEGDDYEDYVNNHRSKDKYDHEEDIQVEAEVEAEARDNKEEDVDVEVATATLVRAIKKEGGYVDHAAVLNMLEQMNFRGSQSTTIGDKQPQHQSSKKDISLNSLANLPFPPDGDSKALATNRSTKDREDRRISRPRSPRVSVDVNGLAAIVNRDKDKEKEKDTESMQSLTFSSTTNSNHSNGQISHANSITSPTLSAIRPSLDLETVESHLCCPLCSDLLLDACVAKCSHGFCQHCLEKYIQNGNKVCPVCDDKAPIFHRKYIDETVYFRSAHIDNLVWLMLESTETSTVENFKLREIASRNFMDAVWSIWAADKQKQIEEMAAQTAMAATTEAEIGVMLGKRSRKERDGDNKNNTPVQVTKKDATNTQELNDNMIVEESDHEEKTEEMQRLNAEIRAQRAAGMQQLEKEISELEARTGGLEADNISKDGQKEEDDDEGEEREDDSGERCDYCAEGGHVEEHCPHKDRPNSESESSDDNDDEDDDKEDDNDNDEDNDGDTVLGNADGDDDEIDFFPRTQLE